MSMIINRTHHGIESQRWRRYPDNWNGADWIAVPTRLELRAHAYAPYCDLVIENGILADILPLPKPEPEPVPPSVQEITEQALAELSMVQAQQHEETQQAIAELSIMIAGGMTNEV